MDDAVDGELTSGSRTGDGRNSAGVLRWIVTGVCTYARQGASRLCGVLHEGQGDRAAGVHRDAIDVGQIEQECVVGRKVDGRKDVGRLVRSVDILAGAVDEDARGQACGNCDGGSCAFRRVIDGGEASVSYRVDKAYLLLRHVLNGDGELAGESGDAKGGRGNVIWVADVVEGVDEGQGSLGEDAGVLLGDEDTIQNFAGRKITAAEIEILTARGEQGGNS